jgi:CRISPR-associated protein Cas2
MDRRHYLVTYDISDDKRRTQVFDALHGYGDHAQYSVFVCQLNPRELAEMRACLQPLINEAEDQVMILDLGKVQWDQSLQIETLGRAHVPPTRAKIV